MKKLFKEREIDKINNEILHEIYPVEALNKYFLLGFASSLNYINSILEQNINDSNRDRFGVSELKEVIEAIAKKDQQVNKYYQRLKHD
ncbi:hypothetical protein AB0Y20_00760 [Heyndrickxia oleronia]|uniref:hypothetical protein n=1 Tax=Heyndrickxia oleronia TaxID=38875 RepID=UPI003F2930E1